MGFTSKIFALLEQRLFTSWFARLSSIFFHESENIEVRNISRGDIDSDYDDYNHSQIPSSIYVSGDTSIPQDFSLPKDNMHSLRESLWNSLSFHIESNPILFIAEVGAFTTAIGTSIYFLTSLFKEETSLKKGFLKHYDEFKLIEEKDTDSICAICLYPLSSPFPSLSLPQCLHCYHSQCLTEWHRYCSNHSNSTTCPLCRRNLESSVEKKLLKNS